MNKMMEDAKALALRWHYNQLYGQRPYQYHLQDVADCCTTHLCLVDPKHHTNIICAAWLHDTIEDCGDIHHQILQKTNQEVLDIVLALTTGEGTRAERFSEDYFIRLAKNEQAVFVKLCDRLCNVYESHVRNMSTYLDMYRKEQGLINTHLCVPKFKGLLFKINSLLEV
jgi:(p)ppGpp synthase/HD superfamily hydrolase